MIYYVTSILADTIIYKNVSVGVFVLPVAVDITKMISYRGDLTHGWFAALY